MEILNNIRRFFGRDKNVLFNYAQNTFADLSLNRMPFGDTIFTSCVELLTDLLNDVQFIYTSGSRDNFNSFIAFVNNWGEICLINLFKQGFVVIGNTPAGLRLLNENEYSINSYGNTLQVNANVDCFVIKSQTYSTTGKSDYALCLPYIKYLDNILSASNSASERLGVLAIMTPKNPNSAPISAILNTEQKKELENELQTEYGALKKQNTIVVLPREMNVSTLSLASIDLKVQEKVKMAVLVIAGKLKVPANQIPLIDAMSSKSLSNGGELREGDFNKYQTFERLLNKTLIQLANAMLLKVDYSIYNKPVRNV